MSIMTTEAESETRRRLIEASERLFAEKGFDVVSLRHITSEAGVNVAAVNYHFGSKEGLILEVIRRRVQPINRRRLEILDRLEEAAAPGAVALEDVLDAYFRPVIGVFGESARERSVFFQIVGRCLAQDDERMSDWMMKEFREVFDRFTAALERALPGVDRREIQLRLLFAAGTMVHTLSNAGRFEEVTGQPDSIIVSTEQLTRELVGFSAGGFRALSVPSGETAS